MPECFFWAAFTVFALFFRRYLINRENAHKGP